MRFSPSRVRGGWLAGVSVLAAALIVSTLVVRIGPDELAVRRGPGGSRDLVAGFHLRLPLLHRIVRYPAAPIVVRGEAVWMTPEGATLNRPFTAEVRLLSKNLGRLDATREDRTVEDLLAARIGADLGWAIEQRAGGRAAETEIARLARTVLPDLLESWGVALERIDLGGGGAPASAPPPAPAEWLLQTRPAAFKLAVIGLDGADWEIIDPLLARGELPVFGRLVGEGVRAHLRVTPPLLSPLLWTTIATGRTPDEHGVVDFLIRDPAHHTKVPITSDYRRVKAIWNLYTEAGRSVDVIAWWATWPAEPIRGNMVTDRVAYSLFGYEAGPEDRLGATYPAELFDAIEPLVQGPEAVEFDDIRRFVAIEAGDYRAARAEIDTDLKQAYRNPVNHLARIIASTETYAAVARRLLADRQPDLFMLYFQGIDEVCHRFAHYMPPKMEMVTEENFRRFRGAVEEFYRYQDEVLGRILADLEPGTAVMVLSDHGFYNGPNRPTDAPADIEGKPAKWHRPYGIWILHGPPVEPGRIDVVTLEDVAPTLLYLSGLPLSEELAGRPILGALRPAYLREHPVARVSTYEAEGGARPAAAPVRTAVDEEMVEKLRSLGYIGPADEEVVAGTGDETATQTTVTYHANLAGVFIQKKQFDRAETELGKALEIYPRYTPALQMLIQVYVQQQRWDDALGVARRVLDSGREFETDLFLQIARIHRERGTPEEGASELRDLEARYPAASEVPAAIGLVQLALDDPQAAEVAFRRALAIDPAAPEPMMRLYRLYRDRGEVLKLRGEIEAALEKNPRSVMHRNWMGLIYQAEGEFAAAEREFLAALDIDPEFPGTLANLGALYGRVGRLDDAETVLRRAVERHPDNLEARVNLGAVLGKLGRPLEAAENLEEAVQLGYGTPDLYNALGRAWFEAGDIDKAIRSLRESMRLDPDQAEVREILLELESQS